MTSAEVIPALAGDTRPFGSARGRRFRAVDGWIKEKSPEYDYGVILLEQPLGPALSVFPVAALTDAQLDGLTANIAGYPSDRDLASRMYFHARTIAAVGARLVQYDIDTYRGQSGSPVWVVLPDGRRIAVAVHTNGRYPSLEFNSGTRITADVLGNLQQWMAEAAVEPAPDQ
jgi:V8-like Glu-specific endopeptidase